MKQTFVLALASCVYSTVSLAGTSLECWDGTFTYNSARLLETPEGMEFTIAGAAIGEFELKSGTIAISNKGYSNIKMHVMFEKETCSLSDVSVACVLDEDATSSKLAKGYLEYNVFDLGSYRKIISPIRLTNISLAWKNSGSVALTLKDRNYAQVLRVDQCDDSRYAPGDAAPRFPARLRDFIQSK